MSEVLRGPLGWRIWSAVALLIFGVVAEGSSQTFPDKQASFEAIVTASDLPQGRVDLRWRVSDLLSFGSQFEASHRLIVGQAALHVGDLEANEWSLVVGRQRLSFGDERLLGANRNPVQSYPGWDGARLTAQHGRLRVDLLAANSSFHRASIAGAFTSIQAGNSSLEPYVLCKRGGSPATAIGLRATGASRGFDYNVEVVSEAREFAAHEEISVNTRTGKYGLETNYASQHFDEFFPARLNKFGTEDPFGWTNIGNIALNYDQALSRKVTISASYRSYWDAEGAYLTGQLTGGLSYASGKTTVAAACGRLLYTRSTAPVWTPYVAIAYRL
jgi:hypothetical protein